MNVGMYPSLQGYSMYKLIGSVWSSDSCHKNLILEPLSCVVKVLLLQYKPEGTKISLTNNGISYSYPSYIQGVFRGAYGDKREDLHNLYHPLCQALRWYDPHNKTYKLLYSECHKGLQVLKGVYDTHSTIHHTINHYLAVLEDPKIMEQNEETPVIKETEGESDEHNSDDEELGSLEQANPIIGHLRNIWSDKELLVIHDLVTLLQTCADHKRDIYSKALEDIVVAKENELYQYIQKISTTY